MKAKIVRPVIFTSAILLIFSFYIPDFFVPDFQSRRPNDFYYEVAIGNVLNHSSVNKFGRNSEIDAGEEEDIWDGGGTWPQPTVAQTHAITSTSASDTGAGTGARTLDISGLDSTGIQVSETITLSGVSAVTTTNLYRIIDRMIVVTVGSGGVNAGDIIARGTTDSTITAQVTTGNNQTLMAIFQIPVAKAGCITKFEGSINRQVNAVGSINVKMLVKPNGAGWQVKHIVGSVASGTSQLQHIFQPPTCFDALSIVKMVASASSNGTDVSAGFDMVLRDN